VHRVSSVALVFKKPLFLLPSILLCRDRCMILRISLADVSVHVVCNAVQVTRRSIGIRPDRDNRYHQTIDNVVVGFDLAPPQLDRGRVCK
jgi:hypothetical protein